MEAVLNFLRENWRFIVEVLLMLVSLLVLLLRKKNKTIVGSDSINILLSHIPDIINQAEGIYGAGKGPEKLSYVLGECIHWLMTEYCLSKKEALDFYGNLLVDHIEKVLETPQKKKGDQ